jgi:hypothetical protein
MVQPAVNCRVGDTASDAGRWEAFAARASEGCCIRARRAVRASALRGRVKELRCRCRFELHAADGRRRYG